MKKIFLMAALILITLQQTSAQTGKRRERKPLTTEQMADRRVELLKKTLQLSNEQVKTINSLIEKFYKDTAKLQRNSEEMKAARKKLNKDIEGVLTKEQVAKFKEMNQRQRPQKPNRSR